MDDLDHISDRDAAYAFRKLVRLLQHRTDVQNIDLMGLAGFCRNCLGDWLAESNNRDGGTVVSAGTRAIVHGMLPAEWKARYQTEATPEQLARMAESLAKNP